MIICNLVFLEVRKVLLFQLSLVLFWFHQDLFGVEYGHLVSIRNLFQVLIIIIFVAPESFGIKFTIGWIRPSEELTVQFGYQSSIVILSFMSLSISNTCCQWSLQALRWFVQWFQFLHRVLSRIKYIILDILFRTYIVIDGIWGFTTSTLWTKASRLMLIHFGFGGHNCPMANISLLNLELHLWLFLYLFSII